MNLSDFDFQLPDHLIARYPLDRRSDSRMLVIDRAKQTISDHTFSELPLFLRQDDCLVLNNTKVIPARLYGQKSTGGKLSLLIERIITDDSALAHIKASRALTPGSTFVTQSGAVWEVIEKRDNLYLIQLQSKQSILEQLEVEGELPIPPYLGRPTEEVDRTRYQTVFAESEGAIAAPTASLHFDTAMLDQLTGLGVSQAKVTLHVGAGTFKPIQHDDITQHVMHHEWCEVGQSAVQSINQSKQKGGRTVAVGTTVVRTLESAEQHLAPFVKDTNLFIKPGFSFHHVDMMLTNFHLPRSTLLLLVSAFANKNLILEAYHHAIKQEYRFFSYGDAMLIL